MSVLIDVITSPALIVPALGAAGVAILKAYKWTLNRGRQQMVDSVSESFVYEIAVNHLPHLYHALELIAAKMDIELPEPPPIAFIPSARVSEHSRNPQ